MTEVILEKETKNTEMTEAFAREFAKKLTGGEFLAMYGDLGAGKTAFVRGLASVLAPDAQVSSPSYSVVNEYGGAYNFCHFDVYRITDEDDLYSVGYYDYSDCIMAVEWSENIPYALPTPRYEIKIEKTGENSRRIKIEKKL